MVTLLSGRSVYRCDACGFRYADKSLAQACEDFCNAHKSCSIAITKHALRSGE